MLYIAKKSGVESYLFIPLKFRIKIRRDVEEFAFAPPRAETTGLVCNAT